jgi:signal transduction histidine kinase
MMSTTLLTLELAREHDIVLVRQRARQLAAEFGLDGQEQTRLATAVSEITRNAFQYASGGRVEFSIEHGPPAMLIARVCDRGPGIQRIRDVLEGRYVSPTGLGVGMVGARRLTDRFEVDTAPGQGTSVLLGKRLPEHLIVSRAVIGSVVSSLAANTAIDDHTELQQQNQELLRALAELREKQTQNERLAQELAETNSGVLALYAELDERAGYLERLNELKTHFLSDLNHEIRTPLNAVRNIARLLLDGYEGELTERQRKAVEMMRSSTDSLSDLVNDWLDLAKIEAGKVEVRIEQFEVDELFGALRALFRPIASESRVPLVFEPLPNLPPLVSDHGKIAQVMRNLISNALKFTDEGEVRVNAAIGPAETVTFTVCDTGIGIAPSDLERIFEEFAQVENPIQRRVKGTGLGLPLSRRLARLVGGEITVRSAIAVGSTFTLTVPVLYGGALTMAPTADDLEDQARRASAAGASHA